MLFRDEFRWHSCPLAAVALLFACVGSPGWASNTGTQKPCTSQSTSQGASANTGPTIGRTIGESSGERSSEREDSSSAEPPGSDPVEGSRASKKGVVDGFCLAYF